LSAKDRFRRGTRDYKRSKPVSPATGHSILIVVEGEKTEPHYFEALRKRLRLSMVEVAIIHPEGTDPITLTEKAVELREKRKAAAKRGDGVPYDETWVVFDLEKQHDIRRRQALSAMVMKEARGLRFATSDPSFEYWLILHFEYTTSPLADSDEAKARLRRNWPEYEKCCEPHSAVIEKLPIAVEYAARCREYHRKAGSDGNPSTNVDQLACSLNNATRPYTRFELK
jgi:hypothetical protein